MVCYRATGGSGYRWSQKALTRELGQETVEKGECIARRVLNRPDEHRYITVEREQTDGSYTAGLRQKYIVFLCLSAGYMLLYVLLTGCLRRSFKRNMEKKSQFFW